MSDLPNRERVLVCVGLGCTAGSPEQAEDIEAILNAYRLGRLVDRKAIDWKWNVKYNLSVTEVQETVVAAIGDTE